MKKWVRNLIIIIVLAILALAGYGYYLWNKPHRDVTNEKGISITAEKIYQDFKTNEQDANKKYLNQAIELTGEVADVSVNQDNNTVADFKTSDPMFVVNCTFKTSPGTLKAGDHITFKGFCTGYIAGSDIVINEGVLVK